MTFTNTPPGYHCSDDSFFCNLETVNGVDGTCTFCGQVDSNE